MMDSLAGALGHWLARLLRLEGPAVALLVRILTIAGTLLLTVIAYRALSHLVDRVLRPLEGAADYSQKAQRARTLGPLLKSAALYLLAFVALMVVLREVGIDIQALLVSAGVVGLAIGLGAQSLIKDVITGFFLTQRFEIENELRRRILEEFRAAAIREPKKVFHVVQER